MTNRLPDTAIANSGADGAATQPLPNSRKIYVTGSRPDIRVPMREISLADTQTDKGVEKNPPVLVYDTSGPYTDPAVQIDLRAGLARSEEHTSELQSRPHLVCRLLLEKKKT